MSKQKLEGKSVYQPTQDFIQYLRSISYLDIHQIFKKVKQFYPQYRNKTEASLRLFMNNYDIQYKKLITCNKNKLIYTEEVTDYINNINKDGQLTLNVILDKLIEKFPGVKFTWDNLYAYCYRHKINFIKCTKPSTLLNKQFGTDNTTHIPNILTAKEQSLLNNNIEIVDSKSTDERLSPIYKEVDTICTEKFNQLNCNIDRDITTDEYISLLETLLYLSKNYTNLIENRKNQHDIMNAYQSDVVHEQENVLSKPGDTYLQDKLYVLRQRRRFYQYDSTNLNSIKPFLQTINIDKLETCLSCMKENKDKRDDIKFIPLVDTSMTQKYDWAVDRIVDKTDIVTKQLGTTSIRKQSNNKGNVYKYLVSCKVSGAGYGAFTPWSKTYMCINEEVAKSLARKELKSLQGNNSGVLFTSLNVTKMNS